MVRTKHFVGERSDLTVVDGDTLFPAVEILAKAAEEVIDDRAGTRGLMSRAATTPLTPLELYVPESPKTNGSVISFGVATKVSRLKEASAQFVHWLADSGCPLHVTTPPDDDTSNMEFYMRDLGMDVHIESSTTRYAIAYFSLIKKLYEKRLPHTKWLALIDDDTFLPSLPTLVEHLSSNYNADKQVMISAMSDNIEQIKSWGVQPFGGGGIFVSIPLAARLSSPDVWDKCIEAANGVHQGDQIISNCLNGFTDVRPIFDAGLHQMDIMGAGETPAGYFESGRRMLTVHHWRTWFRVDVPMGLLVSKACGVEGLFQRWAFPAANMVLSNGFSIAEYPKGLGQVDFSAVEKTWKGDAAKFLHKIGPLREQLGPDKISYRLAASEVVDKMFVRQTYVHHGETLAGEEPQMDRVLELLWLL